MGLSALPDDAKQIMLKHAYDTLEMAVGEELSEGLSDSQLEEFESIIDSKDEMAATRWLEIHVPEYRAITREKFDELARMISSASEDILAAEVASGSGPSRANHPQGEDSATAKGQA